MTKYKSYKTNENLNIIKSAINEYNNLNNNLSQDQICKKYNIPISIFRYYKPIYLTNNRQQHEQHEQHEQIKQKSFKNESEKKVSKKIQEQNDFFDKELESDRLHNHFIEDIKMKNNTNTDVIHDIDNVVEKLKKDMTKMKSKDDIMKTIKNMPKNKNGVRRISIKDLQNE